MGDTPAALCLTVEPLTEAALELANDAWADNAMRIRPDGALEAYSPQRKLQRVRTGSRSPRGSEADLSEEALDAGQAAAATAAALPAAASTDAPQLADLPKEQQQHLRQRLKQGLAGALEEAKQEQHR